MNAVTVVFTGGPAEGRHELPAGPDGRPPARWVVRGHHVPGDHLYERAGSADGVWTMRFVRTDPVGMTQ